MTQARNQETLLAEVKAAHIIIRNALNLMTMDQKSEWGRQNDAAGLVECGSTRAHEREAAIAEAERAALSQPQSQAQGEAVAWQARTHPDSAWFDTPEWRIKKLKESGAEVRPLYAAPVAAQQGLTDEPPSVPIMGEYLTAEDGYRRGWADRAAILSRAAPQLPVAGDGLNANVRTLLEQCRDFIDATKTPAYPAGVDLADAIDALLDAPAASPAPHGWKMVPMIATSEMIRAATKLIRDGKEPYSWDVYAAMLDSAPPAPAAQPAASAAPVAWEVTEDGRVYVINSHKSIRALESDPKCVVRPLVYAAASTQQSEPSAEQEGVGDSYGDTDFAYTFAGITLEEGEKRLMTMLVRALGTDHQAIDDMTALLFRARSAAPSSDSAAARDAADMFWNHDDPERCEDSIHDVVVSAYENGCNVGDIVEVQQAIRLHNVKVRIITDPEDNDEIAYEMVEDAALAAQREGGASE